MWGPGYADEIVCQLDYSADPLGGTGVPPVTHYYLQDANYNVVAVVAPASGQNPAAVLYQYTYGPYGDVLAVDDFAGGTGPVNRLGDQGLFFERLTGAIGDPALLPSDPSIPRTVRGLYHSRNRWLHMELGRFLTRDPAEAALPIITALAFNGDSIAGGTPTLPFSPAGHYGDGFNLYEFVGSNPIVRRDPSGLIWGFALEIVGSGFGMDLRLNDAARVSAGYAALATGLAAIMAQMQWTIGGGMTASGFDLFLEGIDATMSGAYAVGESLITAGEMTCIAVYAMSQAEAVRKARSLWKPISAHWAKLATGGPEQDPSNHWLREIRAWLDKVDQLVGRMKGKTAQQWSQWSQVARDGLEALARGGGPKVPPPMPG